MAKLEKFVKKYNISKHFKYGLGQYGICHTLSHEDVQGHANSVTRPQSTLEGIHIRTPTGALGAFACGLGETLDFFDARASIFSVMFML